MGTLVYGDSGSETTFDDRILAHLQLAIGAKLRRSEGFFFSWRDVPSVGTERHSIWMDAAIPLRFDYTTCVTQLINRDWLEQLALSANAPQGMQLGDEPLPGTVPTHTGSVKAASSHDRGVSDTRVRVPH